MTSRPRRTLSRTWQNWTPCRTRRANVDVSPENRQRNGTARHARGTRRNRCSVAGPAPRAHRRAHDTLCIGSGLHLAANRTAGGAVHGLLRRDSRAGIMLDYTHLASTKAIGYARTRAWHNMVRAGHALYGYVSPPEVPRQTGTECQAGSYVESEDSGRERHSGGNLGRLWRDLSRAAPCASPFLGPDCADGVFHRLSNRGKVIAAGQLTPILGTVSMDLTTIDISHAPDLSRVIPSHYWEPRAAPRWTPSNSRESPALFPTTFFRASAPECAEFTCEKLISHLLRFTGWVAAWWHFKQSVRIFPRPHSPPPSTTGRM